MAGGGWEKEVNKETAATQGSPDSEAAPAEPVRPAWVRGGQRIHREVKRQLMKMREGSGTRRHTQDNRASINPAKELRPPADPNVTCQSVVARTLPSSPPRNASHLLEPCPTGKRLTNAAGQPLPGVHTLPGVRSPDGCRTCILPFNTSFIHQTRRTRLSCQVIPIESIAYSCLDNTCGNGRGQCLPPVLK